MLDSRVRFLNINSSGILARSPCPLSGHLATSSDIFGCHPWGYDGHPVGRDQHCCYRSYNAQDSPHETELSDPKCQQCWGSEVLLWEGERERTNPHIADTYNMQRQGGDPE